MEYDFYVRLERDEFDQYIVSMVDLNPHNPASIPFVFDTGATYTMLNKNLAESQGWQIFKTGLTLGSYVKGAPPTICDLRKIPNIAKCIDEKKRSNSVIINSQFLNAFYFSA